MGEQVAMLVEVEFNDDTIASGLFVHDRLSDSVGACNAAFAYSILAGGTAPGVWFPEHPQAVKDKEVLFKLAQRDTRQFLINKSTWELETEPIQLGLGFYL